MSAPESERRSVPSVSSLGDWEDNMRYCVTATVSYIGWVYVDADSPEAAKREADDCDARDFEIDPETAQVDYNVTPMVEVAM